MWFSKSFDELIKEKTIFDIDQLEEKKDPRSIFLPYYNLGKCDTYYRRGDEPAYTGNFIPVWLYPVFLDKVIMFIPPFQNEKEFKNYCGASPDQVLELIKADLLVPLVGNNLALYKEDVIGRFIKKLPKDKPLIRAQLFEDAKLDGDLKFQEEAYYKAKEYQVKVNEFDARVRKEYEEERLKNPLIPSLDKLPFFIAERAKWQELFGLGKNVIKIENSLDTSPLVAYRTARTLHYVIAPKLYARGGFTMMAYKDDLQLTDEEGKLLAPAFPFGSKEIETVKIAQIIQLPMQDFEIEQAVNLVIEIRERDRKLGEEEKMLRGEINEVMKNLWDTYSFQKKPLEKYEENTKELQHAFGSFSNKLLEDLKTRGRRREIIQTFAGSITSIPTAIREHDWRTLLDSFEELAGYVELATSPLKDVVKAIAILSIKAGLVKKDDPDIVEAVVNQMRKLQGSVELWGEKEEMQTPFMLVRYNNPIM